MNFTDLNGIEGLQFMPVRANKQPIEKGWQTTQTKYDLSNAAGVGIVCGKLSGNLEVIDIDLKYDLTGKLFQRYKRLIHDMDETLLPKLVVQKTKGGGYHFIYRCSEIEGNLKLANRATTDDEKDFTFKKTYDHEIKNGKSESDAKKIADKARANDKVRVLLETRGEGGYIMSYPSDGYEMVFGDFFSIQEINTEQRETLINIARQFNEVVEEYKPHQSELKKQEKGLTPFEDYNDRGDVIGLLETNGWRIVQQKGRKTIFLRPGQTSSASSGNYDFEKKWFSVFTTSTEFQPEKAYQPYAVYAVLNCGGNFSEAAKKLYADGYGDRYEKVKQLNEKTPSRISLIDDNYSFVAKPQDYDPYLNQVRDGTLQMGLSTGITTLDKYFLFKQGNLVMVNGHDNSGKTVVIWYLALLSAMYHGWKWIIFSSENSIGNFMRRMIEFYWGKPLKDMVESEYIIAKKFIETHFTILKSDEELFNYRDLILMAKKLLAKQFYHSMLIDPYNSLKIELNSASKLSTHEYHYEALSEVKLFTRKEGMGMYVNNHVVTGALRLKGDDKMAVAPQKADTEGGGKFANKADDFLTIHRKTQSATEWMYSEIHVRKIKEVETGGRQTPIDDPVRIRMLPGSCGFSEDTEAVYGRNPVKIWHAQMERQEEKTIVRPLWTPYKDQDELDRSSSDIDLF